MFSRIRTQEEALDILNELKRAWAIGNVRSADLAERTLPILEWLCKGKPVEQSDDSTLRKLAWSVIDEWQKEYSQGYNNILSPLQALQAHLKSERVPEADADGKNLVTLCSDLVDEYRSEDADWKKLRSVIFEIEEVLVNTKQLPART